MNENSIERHTLSAEQFAVLAALDVYLRIELTPPSLRELAEQLNLRSPTTVQYHLARLERQGFVHYKRAGKRQRRAPHTVKITPAGREALAHARDIQAAGMLSGDHALELDPIQLAAARRLGLPLNALRHTALPDGRTLVELTSRSERDAWADLILQALNKDRNSVPSMI